MPVFTGMMKVSCLTCQIQPFPNKTLERSHCGKDCIASSFSTCHHTRMEFLWDLFHRIYDVESLVRVGGLIGLTAIVFVETGLLIGFFLPGDSLLVTAGLFAARGDIELLPMIVCLSV